MSFVSRSETPEKRVWYRISSAFYNNIMRLDGNSGINIDGVVYPSANTEAGILIHLMTSRKESYLKA